MKQQPKIGKRAREILAYILEQEALRKPPPSIRQIGERVGLASSSTVHSHLKALERARLVTANRSCPRSRVATDAGRKLVGFSAAGPAGMAMEVVADLRKFFARFTELEDTTLGSVFRVTDLDSDEFAEALLRLRQKVDRIP